MKRFMNKKVAAIGLAAGLALGAAGIAAAYFTNTGTGTGSATVGSVTNPLTVSVSAPTGGALLPTAIGDANATVDTVPVTVTNADEANEYLGSLTYEITPGYTHTDAAGDPACVASDFSINAATPGSSVTVHPDTNLGPDTDAATDSYSTSFTLQLVDNGANQNSCEGQTVPLTVNATQP
ncbi:MAG: hypothetical protein ACLPYY_08270 [Acidimicrobiales bacterium]